MDLSDILLFAGLALFIRLVCVNFGRKWLIFIISVLAVFWLQPAVPVRYLDFWFPVLTLCLVVIVWWMITPPALRGERQNWIALGVIVLLLAAIPLTRHITFEGLLTATRPPPLNRVFPFLVILPVTLFALAKASRFQKHLLTATFVLIILLLVVLKSPWIAENISISVRHTLQQSTAEAAATDLRWLGVSYLAFRLLHVLRDTRSGRLSPVPLRDFINYAVFFPALTAGPIDRLDRFERDLNEPVARSAADITRGGQRLALGLFKKFVLADTLAVFALNPVSAVQVQTSGWSWLLLYAFSFQIYLDFSGYTDIAIGIGQFLGIKLPENFNRPYLQQSLTAFWNNWHMTLTNWVRAYFFNPVTRALRRAGKLSPAFILFSVQLATMALIGLWHGITWNFLLWGAWHGLGLFIQNRWSDWVRPRLQQFEGRPGIKTALSGLNVLITFHYVTLGWVWFALPFPQQALSFMGKLFGIS